MHTNRRQGFTLVELLVVIGIILVLVGITFAVGRSVVGNAKKSATENTLQVLDSALNAYVQAKGENPPATVEYTDASGGRVTLIAIDGVDSANTATQVNSVGAFLVAAQRVPEAKAILDALSTKQLVQLDVDGSGPQPSMPTVLDGWGRPVRFVHPKTDGLILDDLGQTGGTDGRDVEQWLGAAPTSAPYAFAKVRRDFAREVTAGQPVASADSDGGKAVGARGYFYSAGEDGLVGYGRAGTGAWVNFNQDNVYTSPPTFPKAP